MAIINDIGEVIERISYNAYGRPRHHMPADLDGDGNVNNADQLLLHNWRHDLVTVISAAGEIVEQVRYEAYGSSIDMPPGDADMDGRVTSADTSQISTREIGRTYDAHSPDACAEKAGSQEPVSSVSPVCYAWRGAFILLV